MIFLDRVKVFARAGDGGDGCTSFRREKFAPRGGPDGGNGGKGGDIYFEVSPHVNTLYNLSMHPHVRADRGRHGQGSNKVGRSAKDVTVLVPPGTLVYDLTIPKYVTEAPPEDESLDVKGSSGRLLGDLQNPGEKLCIAKGGRGGRGNAAFKSNADRAPRRRESGFPGEEKTLILELKLLADVGLAGLPNAGKSSLLARLTAARPKVAAYPFTTTHPVLGICAIKDQRVVIADLPGLIEGAHEGKGLGSDFLRHVERTKALLHLVEPKGKGVIKDLEMIEKEMELWNPALLNKPRLLVVTKADLGAIAQKTFKEIAKKRPKHKVFLISSQTGEGMAPLLKALLPLISRAAAVSAL